MGMSSSQCRLLSLTARLSNLEHEAQAVSNSKLRLASRSEDASRDYQIALNKDKLVMLTGVGANGKTYADATAHLMTTYGAISATESQRMLKDSSGKLVVSDGMGKAYDSSKGVLADFLKICKVETDSTKENYDPSRAQWYTNIYNEIAKNGYFSPGDAQFKDSQWLYNELSNGNIYLEKWNDTAGEEATGAFEKIAWDSGDNSLQKKADDSELAKAEADYNVKLASIQTQDKKYDMQLQEIQTEHTAVQTEYDSVKKVIEKNVDRTFKTFNA